MPSQTRDPIAEQRRAGFVWFPGSRRSPSPRPPELFRRQSARRLVVLWEAADRICGKRLKAILPGLISAMERHKHLSLDPTVRGFVLSASPATIDRLLNPIRSGALPRHQAETCYQAQQADPDPNIRRLERAGARVRRDRLCGAWRHARCAACSCGVWWRPTCVRVGWRCFRWLPESNPWSSRASPFFGRPIPDADPRDRFGQ